MTSKGPAMYQRLKNLDGEIEYLKNLVNEGSSITSPLCALIKSLSEILVLSIDQDDAR